MHSCLHVAKCETKKKHSNLVHRHNKTVSTVSVSLTQAVVEVVGNGGWPAILISYDGVSAECLVVTNR